MRMEKIIERLERDKEIKFEEHQTLEQVQKNFQSAYIENDIVFWEINDQMPFEEMTTNFVLAGFITKEQKEKTDYAREKDDDLFWNKYFNKRKEA